MTIDREEPNPRGAGSDATGRDWQLWRQDDAGNRHLVRVDLSEDEARRLRDDYEARGHKQFYWIQRAS
jgi:hypothetical protein